MTLPNLCRNYRRPCPAKARIDDTTLRYPLDCQRCATMAPHSLDPRGRLKILESAVQSRPCPPFFSAGCPLEILPELNLCSDLCPTQVQSGTFQRTSNHEIPGAIQYPPNNSFWSDSFGAPAMSAWSATEIRGEAWSDGRTHRDLLPTVAAPALMCSRIRRCFLTSNLFGWSQGMTVLDVAVAKSLKGFLAYVRGTRWEGRENEAISLYAFGFLRKCFTGKGVLRDPMQIGIEVGAADTPKGKRSQVRKDLVIWRKPGCNRWHPDGPRSEPLAIMEWKVRRTGFRSGSSNDRDIEWLTTHCKNHRKTVGYAVWLDLRSAKASLSAERFDSHGSRPIACG